MSNTLALLDVEFQKSGKTLGYGRQPTFFDCANSVTMDDDRYRLNTTTISLMLSHGCAGSCANVTGQFCAELRVPRCRCKGASPKDQLVGKTRAWTKHEVPLQTPQARSVMTINTYGMDFIRLSSIFPS